MDTESGTAGGIVFFILFIMILGIVYLIYSPLMDEYTNEVNKQITSETIPATQERTDALAGVLRYWYAAPVIFLIGGILYLWKIGLDDTGGTV